MDSLTNLLLAVSNESAANADVLESWINFSAFLSRSIAAGLYDQYERKSQCRYASIDIPEGLETFEPAKPKPLLRCKELVAMNWIRYAESAIETLCFGDLDKDFGSERWCRWVQRLKEIETDDEVESQFQQMAGETWRRMAKMHPELFKVLQPAPEALTA